MRPFVFLLPLALAAQAPPPPPKPGSVDGTVVNSVTGAPVKKCSVMLERERFRYLATTDDQGRFAMPDVEPGGGYSVRTNCAGFQMPDPSHQEPIAVVSAQRVADLAVKVIPLGAISGRIVDPDGEPLRGVSVQALQYRYVPAGKRLDVAADATSDERGRYRLHSLPPGPYVLRAFLRVTPPGPDGAPGHVHNSIPDEGFLPAWNPGPPEAAAATALNVPPAADLTSLDFRLGRTPVFHIRGELITTVAPPPRIVAAACSTAGIDRNYAFPADRFAERAFSVRGLPPGQYCLSASQSYWRQVSADAVVAVADRDVNGVILQAPAPAVYEGSVEVDSAAPSQPLTGLRLMWQDASQSSCCSAFVVVRDNGAFATRPLAAGSYVISLASLPKGVYLKSLQLGDKAIAGNRIDIQPGAGKLKVVLGTDAGRIQGTVRDADGKPASVMVTVALKGRAAGRFDLIRSVRAQPDGSFQFPDLRPGDYSVFAWEIFQEDAAASPDYLARFAGSAASVTVGSSETAAVQVKSIPAKEVEDARWRVQ